MTSLPIFYRPFSRGRGITLLVPFRPDGPGRARVWEWLRAYWEHELPAAEIVMGSDDKVPFCKTAAVNRAFRRSRGKIVVILDADCYLPGSVILECARRIWEERSHGRRLWFIPYRRFYRLTEHETAEVLESDPRNPRRIPDPPPQWMVEDQAANSGYGHWFGALIQIMPREAFIAAGGMDERFNAGWGGDDVAFMAAVDTLYAKHRTTGNGVFHLWHPYTRGGPPWERMWSGQQSSGGNNDLTTRYTEARGRSRRMHDLTREPGANGEEE